MSPPWILKRLANISPIFNSLTNRLRITNYCLRSVSSSLLKFTRFIQGNNIAWTNLDMIRNLQHLHWNLFWIKMSCGPSNNNHCKLLMANVLQWKKGPTFLKEIKKLVTFNLLSCKCFSAKDHSTWNKP
jgi:hypothetical protein